MSGTMDDNYWELFDLGVDGINQNSQGLMPWWTNTKNTNGIPCDPAIDADCSD